MENQAFEFEPIVGSEFPNKVIPLIDHAKESIKIVMFDWRWYPNMLGNSCQLFNSAIVRAANHGVKVRVMTNAADTIKYLRLNKVSAKKPNSKKLLHSKLMIIDDEVVILGSHNYTQNAFTANQEISVMIKAKNQIARFLDYFEKICLS